jgi:hypothetical protein
MTVMIASTLFHDVACHMEAAMNQQDIYKKKIDTNGEANILDFGCGPTGAGRAFIECQIMGTRNKLSLFDPGANINPSNYNNVSVVNTEQVFGPNRDQFDIVNISYVLCLMEPREARETLERLKEKHSSASFIIIDYTLDGRSKMDVQNLLVADTEKRWRQKLGEEEFYRTHSRFSPESLSELVNTAGIQHSGTRPLDKKNLRASITC